MVATPDFIFEVMTPLGFHVHTTPAYWDVITKIKHSDYGRAYRRCEKHIDRSR